MPALAKTAFDHRHEPAWANSKECAFCSAKSTTHGRLIASNTYAQAFLGVAPIVPGHTLIAPIRCVATIAELTPVEFHAIFQLQNVLHSALTQMFGAIGFNF